MIKTILWDFDGVIVESVNVKTEAFRDMYIVHGQEIAQKVVDHHMAHGGISRFEKFKIYHENFLNKQISNEELDQLADQFSNLVLRKVIESPYIPGVLGFIQKNQANYQHFIISGTPHEEMNLIIENKNLTSLFKGVMGSPKTKSEWIFDLVKQNKIEIANSVFVGDATTDYNAAIKTGTKFVLREVDYNLEYFKSYQGPRVKNFLGFEKVIEAI